MRIWLARLFVFAVFSVNVYCAFSFILFPELYLGPYELSGVAGTAALQGIGVTFLMWNITYPVVFVNPTRHRTVYVIVLVQQIVGLVGESIILAMMPGGHQVLAGSILRFIVFDASGLVLLIVGFIITRKLATGKPITRKRR